MFHLLTATPRPELVPLSYAFSYSWGSESSSSSNDGDVKKRRTCFSKYRCYKLCRLSWQLCFPGNQILPLCLSSTGEIPTFGDHEAVVPKAEGRRSHYKLGVG